MEQRSEEWFAARKGKLTASTFGEAIGLVGSRKRLWREITGRQPGQWENAAMAHGVAYEPLAKGLYRAYRGLYVEPVGFVLHDDHDWLGGSPDGLVNADGLIENADGLIEIKCPVAIYDAVPEQYMPQVQGLLEITNRDWCDFVAWTPEVVRLWRIRRSTEYWDALLDALAAYWIYVLTDVEPPTFKRGGKPAMPYSSVAIDVAVDL